MTPTHADDVAAIAAALTAGEIAALRTLVAAEQVNESDTWGVLNKHGLVNLWDDTKLTPLGYAVLRHLEAAPPATEPTAGELWAGLSADEREWLNRGEDYVIPNKDIESVDSLHNKKMIQLVNGWFQHTTLGRDVLAAGTASDTGADVRPATITVSHWNDIAKEVASEQCVVTFDGWRLLDLNYIVGDDDYPRWSFSAIRDVKTANFNLSGNEVLSVEWLHPQAPAQPVAADPAAEDGGEA